MGIAEIIAAVSSAATLIEQLVSLAQVAAAKGEITPEELARVRSAAKISDESWDSAVQNAKARLSAR